MERMTIDIKILVPETINIHAINSLPYEKHEFNFAA
jgi:hypothetical protein